MKFDVDKFEDLKEVMGLFDLEVLTDIGENNGTPIYALGRSPELAAGLRGFTTTPYFKSLNTLDSFCADHIEKFREFSDAHPDDGAPDATDWK